jgi:DNA-binding NtrC family response regulator
VFLDELGETPLAIQVKLLRVLQTRVFQRLGDTAERRFQGKVIAATNRDLAQEIAEGRFREDFYFRLCSDRIETPSLSEQIAGSRAELRRLCGWVVSVLMPESEANKVADDFAEHLERDLGLSYPWPGNFRELEQAARTFTVRRRYVPLLSHRGGDIRARWARAYSAGEWTADAVLNAYCARVLELSGGNFEEAARRLELDPRTVKARARALRSD